MFHIIHKVNTIIGIEPTPAVCVAYSGFSRLGLAVLPLHHIVKSIPFYAVPGLGRKVTSQRPQHSHSLVNQWKQHFPVAP